MAANQMRQPQRLAERPKGSCRCRIVLRSPRNHGQRIASVAPEEVRDRLRAETLAVWRGPHCNWVQFGTPGGGSTPRAEGLLTPSMTLPPHIRWTDRGTGTVIRRWFESRCVSRSHTSFHKEMSHV